MKAMILIVAKVPNDNRRKIKKVMNLPIFFLPTQLFIQVQ